MVEPCEMTVVATDRLVVRPWRTEEADRVFDIFSRREVVHWLGAEPMQDRREASERIERWLGEFAPDAEFGSWAVVERTTGVVLGGVGLKPLPEGAGEVEIFWHFHPDSWGHGFATESARAVLARGFAGGLAEVWAVTYLDNRPSAAVCRRIGMQLLGVTNRWYHKPFLMFWAGSRSGQSPSLQPDGPAPAEPSEP